MKEIVNIQVPTLIQVYIFFDQKGFGSKEAEAFFNEYSIRNWKGRRGIMVKNWRAKALDWMWKRQKNLAYLRSKSKLIILKIKDDVR